MKKLIIIAIMLSFVTLTSCASVPELKSENGVGIFKAGKEKSWKGGFYRDDVPGAYAIQVATRQDRGWGYYKDTEVWQWQDGEFKFKTYFAPKGCSNGFWMPNNKIFTRYVRTAEQLYDNPEMAVIDIITLKEERKLNDWIPYYWNPGSSIFHYSLSNNGNYIVFNMDYSVYQGGPWDDKEKHYFGWPIRVCLYDTKKDEFKEACVLEGEEGTGQATTHVSDTYVTDDGSLIGLAGRGWGTSLIDVKAGELRWEVKPESCHNTTVVAITPDGSRVYSGSTNGIMYEFDAKDGKVIAEHNLVEMVGTRQRMGGFADLQISSNGKWIAVVSGNVFLYNRETGKVEFMIRTPGYRDCVVFSPDSCKIAVFSSGEIRTYTIPVIGKSE